MDPREKIVAIEDYLEQYSRELDHYAKVASLVHQKLEGLLSSQGVRAMVTSRAKSLPRLRDKLYRRHKLKKYDSLRSIQSDIIDVAGTRVALYFPGDKSQVSTLIIENFDQMREPKVFPEINRNTLFLKRFPGYIATHFLVKLRSEIDGSIDHRYCNTPVEIQVASVLMHAWSEVEHDLEYKPETGSVSKEESAILDEINGLVLTGELTLERLQEAARRRLKKANVNFANQYELASYLAELAQRKGFDSSNVGRVDILFAVLRQLGFDQADKLNEQIAGMDESATDRPLADLIIDSLSLRAGEPGKLARAIIAKVLSGSEQLQNSENARHLALGRFLDEWQKIESFINSSLQDDIARVRPFSRRLDDLSIRPGLKEQLKALNELRNRTIHNRSYFAADQLNEFAEVMRTVVLPSLREEIAPTKRKAKQQTER